MPLQHYQHPNSVLNYISNKGEDIKKKLSGWIESVIVGGSGVVGLFLGIVIARGIGMADGLGLVIGMSTGIIGGMNFLMPYLEKRNKEEREDN